MSDRYKKWVFLLFTLGVVGALMYYHQISGMKRKINITSHNISILKNKELIQKKEWINLRDQLKTKQRVLSEINCEIVKTKVEFEKEMNDAGLHLKSIALKIDRIDLVIEGGLDRFVKWLSTIVHTQGNTAVTHFLILNTGSACSLTIFVTLSFL